MDKEALKMFWETEERFPFSGWDFSHIAGRCFEEPLPWDYGDIVRRHMKGDSAMLDMGTGGGEFLLSLRPPAGSTYATEGYAPNVERASAALAPHGIELRTVEDDSSLPFGDGFFGLVINRHESFCLSEIYRILKKGGVFITQQVGESNNREISKFLLGCEYKSLQNYPLAAAVREAEALGFDVYEQREFFPETRYSDVGALVFMAKIIEWEFPGFSVDACFDRLLELQETVDRQGYISAFEHRYLLAARKM
jgi:SAM-dependent methyltransferase